MGKLIYLYVLYSLIACVDKDSNVGSKNDNFRDNTLRVSMEVKVLEDDRFQLFYMKDSPVASYTSSERIEIPLKGSENFQTVEFVLPENIFPSKFRIDVGEAGLLSQVEIKSVKLNFNTNLIEIENSIFDRFFKKNIYLENSKNGFFRKEINGKYDPFFESKALLIQKMKIEFLIGDNSSF